MKKLLFILAIMFATVSYVNAQPGATSQTFQLTATVAKYLAVNPAYLSNDVNPIGAWNQTIVDPAVNGSNVLPGWPAWKVQYKDNVYANCPFTVTYTGTGGGAPLPILSREEVNGNGFDRLQTLIIVRNEINGEWPAAMGLLGHESHDMKFVSDAEGAATGTFTGNSQSFLETPHDGEVNTTVWMSAALPHATPEFGVDNTWNQSADAGVYTCQVRAVYAVLPAIALQ
jgi:hypothetical protein